MFQRGQKAITSLIPSNFVTRIVGATERELRDNQENLSLIFSLLGVVVFCIGIAYPTWPLYNLNSIYWFFEIATLYLLAAYIRHDSAKSAAPPYTLKRAALIALVLSLRPLIGLIQEAYICAQFDSQQRADLALCNDAVQSNYVDANSKLACAAMFDADVSSLATGQCPFLLGSASYGAFVQASQFMLILFFIFKNILLFYIASILVHLYAEELKLQSNNNRHLFDTKHN
jgi:hypothetical protein